MHQVTCETCHQPTAAHDVVNYGSIEGGYRRLCGRCFNLSAASRLGLKDFGHVGFEPVCMVDARGGEHEFHFRTRLIGPGMALDAFELLNGIPGGYRFQAIGEVEDDPLALLSGLISRMRRSLSLTHFEDTGHGPQVSDRLTLRGIVDSDPDNDARLPLVVVDGREFTWEELGRMVATFEGWQFKLEFRDLSEEL
jgi:hypothetical protein